MILLRLPYPTSANHHTRNLPGQGRVKTKAYKAWITHAGWELKLQRPVPIDGPVMVAITLERPKPDEIRDADNAVKPLLDLLVRHKLIPTDSHQVVRSICVAWAPDSAPITGVEVRVLKWCTDRAAIHEVPPEGARGAGEAA